MAPTPPDKIEFIRANYKTLGVKGTAERTGLHKATISKIVGKLGLRLNKDEVTQILRKAAHKPDHERRVNPDTFKQVKSGAAAYILGLIWADGGICLHVTPKISLTQAKDDMVDIIPALQKTGDWRFHDVKRYKGHHKSVQRAITTNRPFGEYLVQHGYASKSVQSASSIIDTIPIDLQHYFFRGLFDGDGHLRVKQMKTGYNQVGLSISSHFKQDWSYMIRLCEQLGIDYLIVRGIDKQESIKGTHQRNSSFRICRHRDIETFLSYIYQGWEHDGFGLKRKWLKYLEFKTLDFKRGHNRYVGVHYLKERNIWQSTIPAKSYGLIVRLLVGEYKTEKEAFIAQQDKIKELGLERVSRSRLYGVKYQTA